VTIESAPGRVNIVGEHTDYNDGLVLPAAIALRTRVELARRADDLVSVASEGWGAVRYRLGAEERRGDWTDYVRGVTVALRDAGARIAGFDARVTSEIPAGAGLASSAALMVALLRALRSEFGLALDDRALAERAHRAETTFVGARVGLMDQLACALGAAGGALAIDLRGVAIEPVALPAALALVVVDSGVPHANRAGGYAMRRRECDDARARLGLRSLRDATAADADRLVRDEPLLGRRVRHVVTENGRVRDAVDALRAADLVAVGEIVSRSHASLRDDFEVSTPVIDLLVRLLGARPGVLGARIVGGGFGGSVLAIARRGAAAEVDLACAAYREESGRPGRVLFS
jgi:galactokinase